MSKYKVGDKVRIRRDLERGDYGDCYATDGMASHAGKVVTIREISTVYPNRFSIVEHLSECDYNWRWSDEMVEPDYKIGDHVVVESSNIEDITKYEGETGVIEKYWYTSGGFNYLVKMDRDSSKTIWCNVKCLVEDKKVFTKDDLKTGMFGVTNRGEKFVVVNDRFVYEDGTWDYAKLEFSSYHVAKVFDGLDCFNQLTRVLNGENKRKPVYDYNRDTKPVEPPKPLYNGKVVCINLNGTNKRRYTVGKIYQFKEGILTDDTGDKITNWNDKPFESFEDFTKFSGSKWIEIKE